MQKRYFIISIIMAFITLTFMAIANEYDSEKYIGQLIKIVPVEGKFTWSEGFYDGKTSKSKGISTPSPFTMKLNRMFFFDGKRRGGIGKVLDAASPYNELWVRFSCSWKEEIIDLETVREYHVSLGKTEPVISENGWPEFINNGNSYTINGKAEIYIDK